MKLGSASRARSAMPVLAALFCGLMVGGCGKSEKEETFGRLGEDGRIANALVEQVFPEEYRSLPPLCVKKRGEAFNVWLELRDWQQGEKPWLQAGVTDTQGDAAHAIADLTVTESGVRFGKGYRVRALKVIWPEKQAEDLRQGRFGALRLEHIDTAWQQVPKPNGATLRVALSVRNTGKVTREFSGECYLTGDDSVLISKLSSSDPAAIEKTKASASSGFVDADSFFISEISPNSARAFELITDTLQTDVLSKFRTLRVEHLAYGWRRDIAHPQGR